MKAVCFRGAINFLPSLYIISDVLSFFFFFKCVTEEWAALLDDAL